jgi:putative ABC transport system permease protein
VIVDGRLPVGPNEVAIGTRMSRRLGVAVGGAVTMSLADGEFDMGTPVTDVKMTVVGTALAPMFGESDIGDVSVVTFEAIRAGGGDTRPRFVMARFAGGDRAATSAQLDRAFTEDQLTDIIPARVVNMHKVRSVPLLGIGLAGALGAISLVYVIVAGARAHRRDVAVLRAIGLQPSRVRAVLIWQGVLTALVATAIGLPLSLVAGAALWRRVVHDTGVQPGSVIPSAIVLVVPIALAAAVGASLVVDIRFRRSRVAELLHDE